MKNPEAFFKDIVLRVAQQSECLSRNVGAIITIDNRIIAQGFNSPPKKCSPESCLRCNKRSSPGKNMELALCQHAEQGAIATAASLGIAIKGGVMYCTTKPCASCATLIVHSGISEVCYIEEYPSQYTDLIFQKAKVICRPF